MHQYALVYRPAGIGTIPRGIEFKVAPRPSCGDPHHEMARHGVLQTHRHLTDDELRGFELAPLIDGDAVKAFAIEIAQDMGEYAQAYLRKAETSETLFFELISERARRSKSGVMYSIGSMSELSVAVVEALRLIASRVDAGS